MVTPEIGTATFRGASGRTYMASCYVSDVANAPVLISLVGTATSASPNNYWVAPEQVTLADFSIAAGNTVATGLRVDANFIPTGNVISLANSVNTLSYRVPPNLVFKAGSYIQLVQV